MDDRQLALKEFVSGVERVPGATKAGPGPCKMDAELPHSFVALRITTAARPCPLNAQRRLAPAFRESSHTVRHGQAYASTGDGSKCLGSELKRDSRLDWEKKEAYGSDLWGSHRLFEKVDRRVVPHVIEVGPFTIWRW